MVISMDTTLDVIAKYKSLVTASLDGDSFYIRVKETLEQLVTDNIIKKDESAGILTTIMGQLGGSINSSAMANALEWEKTEKTLYLAKIKAELEADILANEKEKSRIEAITAKYAAIKLQADIRRQDGTYTLGLDGITVTMLGDDGLVYQEILNKQEENKLIVAKTSDVWASTNKTVADTYQTYGMHSGYMVTSDGLSGVQDNTPMNLVTLTSLQKSIAKEQAKGYAYNAWSSAATSSANMIGVLLTSETADVTSYATPKAAWETSITQLKNAALPVFTA
jgi:hypothetical protein